MTHTGNDTGLFVIFILAILFLTSLLLVSFIRWVLDFRWELKRLKSEIGRTKGREQERWKRKKKKLWLSLLPFVRYRK